MNKQIFSVFDACARRYLRPFFADSIEEAIRSFRAICNEQEHQFHQHRMDYSLFHLGHFDFETGRVDPLVEPHNLGMAASMIATEVMREGLKPTAQLDLVDELEREA